MRPVIDSRHVPVITSVVDRPIPLHPSHRPARTEQVIPLIVSVSVFLAAAAMVLGWWVA